MSSVRKALPELIWIGLYQAIAAITPLLTIPVLTRAFGPELFGETAILTSFAAYVGMIAGFGFSLSGPAVLRRFDHDRVGVGKTVSAILASQLALFVAGCLLVALIGFMAGFLNRHFWIFVIFSAQWASSAMSPQWLAVGLGKAVRSAQIQIASRLMSVVLLVFWVRGPDDLGIFAIVSFFGSFLGLAATLWLVRSDLPFRVPDFQGMLEVTRESIWLVVSGAGQNIYINTTVVIVGAACVVPELAAFALADKLRTASHGFLSPIIGWIYPTLCRKGEMGGDGALKRTFCAGILGLSVVMGAVMFGGAGILVSLLGGAKFVLAVPVLRAFALLPPFYAIGIYCGNLLLAAGFRSIYNLVSLSMSGFGLACVAIGARLGGLEGAVAAVVLTGAVSAMVLVVAVARLIGLGEATGLTTARVQATRA